MAIIKIMNMKIAWAENIVSGIDAIDEEHLGLIKRINQAIKFHLEDRIESEIEFLDSIIEIARAHFHAEEKILSSLNYCKLSEHQQLHDDIEQKLISYKEGLKKGIPVEHSLEFIRAHWLSHMINEVKDFKSCDLVAA